MNNPWFLANLLVFGLSIGICLLEKYYKHISFGWGLGDLLWHMLLHIAMAIQVVLTIVYWNRGDVYHKYIALSFFAFLVLLALKATIWRGSEYPWNGRIFYDYGKDR
ncbi:MAG: hypothetical protein AAFV95_04455 [Bacteroidota bacterium]